jgi:hypothetical protein
MQLKYSIFFMTTSILLASCSIPAFSVPTKVIGTMADDPVYKNRANTSKSAIAESGKLHPPIGKIILIRSNSNLCAIQFGESQLLKKRESLKDEPIISRLYTWQILKPRLTDVGLVTLDSGNNYVRVGPNTSLHMTPGIDYSKNKISCGGRFELTGDIGGWVANYPTTKQTYEFAATPWEKITDIELQHPKLQWINLRSEAAKFIILNLDF